MQKNSYSGKFIVFEGLDGSGQSTQANLLKDFLIKQGFLVVLTKEPTLDSVAGKEIRKILDKKTQVRPVQLQKLFAQDRKEHLEKIIIPALKKGEIVISDRYFFSSFAYGSASGVSLQGLFKLNKDFLVPDLTFLLKVSPKICLERIKKRGDKRTLFEEKRKLTKVWQVYKLLPKKFKNVNIINGEKSIKEVFSQIKKMLRDLVNNLMIFKNLI
jgi:dTMP kinase